MADLISSRTMATLRAISARAMPDVVTAHTRTPAATASCRVATRGGRTEEADGVRTQRGDYTLTLAYADTLVLLPDEEVQIASRSGRVYRVVWAPGVGPLSAHAEYGLEEVR